MKSFCKLLLIILIIDMHSCSTTSSASEDIHSDNMDSYSYLPAEAVVYASSISNLISTFPKFRNDAVNLEVSRLKAALSEYLEAIRNFDQHQKQRSLNSFEKTYKKIQKLRKFMITDDDEVLNRYLVKIKTNMNLLESSQAKEDSTSSVSSN